ncbi:unnamed protein product [Prorocentrum cordatum]|uniref:Uncharacterized protein n=1 Tax=Prorocentrum cordatum TaxID=2364126 RepID=A0ABN9VJB0_9DINO|nr:unnamed protein product [Polarella glacialis]
MAAMAPIGEEPGVAKLAEQGLAQVADFFSGGIPAPWGGAEEGGAEEGRDSWSFPDVGIPAPWGGAEQGGPQRGGSWGFPDVGLSSLLGQGPECPEGPREAGGAAGKELAAQASSSAARGRGGLAGPDGGLHRWHRKLAGAKGRMDGTSPKETDAQLSQASQTSQVSSISTASGATSLSQKKISTASAASQRSSASAGAPQIATFTPWKPADKPAKKPSGGAADPQPAAALARKPPQIATLQPWKPLDKAAAAPPQPMAVPQIATTSGGGGGGGGAADPQPAAVPARKPAQIATLQQWRPAAKAEEQGLGDDEVHSSAMQAVAAPPQPMAVPQIATTSGGGGGGGGAADPQPAAVPARKPAQIATLQPWRPAAKAEEQGLGDDEVHSSAMQVPSEPLVRIPEAAAQPAPGAPEPPECTSSEPPVCSTMSYPTLDDSMMLHAGLLNPGAAAASPRRASLDTCLEDPAAEDPAPAPAPAHAAARPAGPDGDSQRPACLLGAGLVGHVVTTGTDLDLTSLDQQMPGGQPLHR